MPITPERMVDNLLAPIEPAHGVWQIYRRAFDALATLIEQNEKIIELLGPAPISPEKK